MVVYVFVTSLLCFIASANCGRYFIARQHSIHNISSWDTCLHGFGGNGVQCNGKDQVFMKLDHCLTFDENTSTATIGLCPYFDMRQYNVFEMTVNNV